MGVFGTEPAKIIERGTRWQGVLTGIHYRYTHDEWPKRIENFAIRLANGTTLGVRQHLEPNDTTRLGMAVDVWELKGEAVIDWATTCSKQALNGAVVIDGWKSLKEPPADGIVDDNQKNLHKKGIPAVMTVTSTSEREFMWGLTSVVDMDVVVVLPGEEAYSVTVKRIEVPPYATHLPVKGAKLACVVPRRLDKPVVDWAASAMQAPGVGVPSVQLKANTPPGGISAAASDEPVLEQIAAVADRGDIVGGISLGTYVAVQVGLQSDRVPPSHYDAYAQQHGVAPGTWAVADAAWQAHMRTDWRIGAAFGEAFEAEQERRERGA